MSEIINDNLFAISLPVPFAVPVVKLFSDDVNNLVVVTDFQTQQPVQQMLLPTVWPS